MVQTFLDALKSQSAYPIPQRTLEEVAVRRGLALEDEATFSGVMSPAFQLAVADVMLWLSLAPDVSQGGQSFSFTDEQRQQYRKRANAIYTALGDEQGKSATTTYGYKGTRL